MNRLLLAYFALLTVAAGCDASSSEPAYRRVLGSLSGGEDVRTITVPETVRAGQSVSVTVLTDGSTCEKESDAEVSFVDGAVEIRPYDLTQVLRRGEACGFLLKRIPHTVAVVFPAAGPILVRAVGQSYAGTPQTYELGIVVR